MPIHVPPLSRRQFLLGSAALGLGLHIAPTWAKTKQQDPDHWALLSDTHIAADPKHMAREINMAENLRRVVAEITALDRLPSGLLINGDLAFNVGTPGDYTTLGQLIQPLTLAGIPLHLSLGNHDQRENVRAGLLAGRGTRNLLADHHVSLIETRRANWFLLDTLDRTNHTPGKLGEAQRKWLAAALDARPNRPALVVCHHDPQFGNPEKITGLVDTRELLELLVPRKQVKALIFGHTHRWGVRQQDGLHLINLPPTAYVFRPTDPAGWIDVRLAEQGAVLEFRSLDPTHAVHGQKTELRWRGG